MPEADGLGTSDKGKRNTASLPVAATGHLALGGVGRTDAARTQYEAADAAERSRKYINTATIVTAKVVVIFTPTASPVTCNSSESSDSGCVCW